MTKVKRNIIILFTFFLINGCSSNNTKPMTKKGNVYYEIFVKSFYDSDNNGSGDLNGVTQKLDYLNELGISGLWLMPIMTSNTYHKYDVTNYTSIDEEYGTMEDFDNFVNKAQAKDIDIIIDLVLNHSADDHEWFLKAKESLKNGTCDKPDSYCDYYNFSKDQGSNYYPLAGTDYYYEAIFWNEMPDLNLDSDNVRKEITDIVDFWMKKGIKGFRLDAILHFYNGNTTKNVDFLKWFNELVKTYDDEAYVVGEAWTDSMNVSEYYKAGISCFDFALSQANGKIVSSIKSANGESLAKYVNDYNALIKNWNPKAVNSTFISNHDQGRSAAYFFNDINQSKLMAATYLLMPGIPFIYYGEEIGMLGSGKDENKRLAFIWDSQNNEHQCSPIEGNDYTKTIENGLKQQIKDKDSLYNYYKKLIQIRNTHSSLVSGTISYPALNNKALYMLETSNNEENIMVIHNFSNESTVIPMPEKYSKITDYISPQNKKATLKASELEIPAFSTLIIE